MKSKDTFILALANSPGLLDSLNSWLEEERGYSLSLIENADTPEEIWRVQGGVRTISRIRKKLADSVRNARQTEFSEHSLTTRRRSGRE